MEDFIISVSENQKVKIERENLHHGEKKDVYIPVNSFLENESPNYEDFLFSYDFVVKEKWKKQKGLENHRLLTVKEWDFIFSIRPQKYFHVEINNINGIILMPDNVDFPLEYKPYLSQASARILDIKEWHMLEKMGAIFLPGANFNGNNISPYALKSKKEGRQIGYWIAPLVAPINEDDKLFVRLVKDVKKDK